MQRLVDHFRPAPDVLPIPASPDPLPAEKPNGAGLRVSAYAGLPVWFHEASGDACLRAADGRAFWPDDAIACIQLEHYVGAGAAGSGSEKGMRALYYLLKPLLPRAMQLHLQRANARKRLRRVAFPTWPQDATLDGLFEAFLLAWMRLAGVESLPFLGFWPHGKTWAWSLTHDVDTAVGYAHVDLLARAEEQRGLASAWYFVPERYAWEASRLTDLKHRGHEIGVHGLEHSGKLFENRKEFEKRRDRINGYGRQWQARGFRSPATYRHPFWLTELHFDHDSSYLDVATFEPQRGGVCAPFPFMLNERLVELPITLPMDHTLRNILRQDVYAGCKAKAEWIRARHGLAVALFHPDYNTRTTEVDAYAALLDSLLAAGDAWRALPAEVADWWQRRRASRIVSDAAGARIEGPAAPDGRVWWAHRSGERLTITPDASGT